MSLTPNSSSGEKKIFYELDVYHVSDVFWLRRRKFFGLARSHELGVHHV